MSPGRTAAVLFCIALALRLGFCFVVAPAANLDVGPHNSGFYTSSDGYIDLAVNLIEYGRLTFDPDVPSTVHRGPIFPAAIAVLYRFMGNVAHATLWVNCICGALASVLIYGVALLFYERRTALWGGSVAVCFPLPIYYCANAYSDIVLTFLIVAMIYGGLLILRKPTLLRSLLTGVMFAAATLTKATALPFTGLLVVVALFKDRRSIVGALIAAGVGLGLISMWTVRNFTVRDQLVLVSGGGGFNLLVGNFMIETSGDTDFVFKYGVQTALDRVKRDHDVTITRDDLRPGGHYDVDPVMEQYFSDSAMMMIKDRPALLLRKLIVNTWRFMSWSSSRQKSMVNLIINWPVCILGLIGLYGVRTTAPLEAAWVLTFVVVYVGLYALIIVSSSRFCMPVMLMLIPFASATLLRWISPDSEAYAKPQRRNT